MESSEMCSLALGYGNEMLMGKKPIARSLRVETFHYLREILSHCDLVRKVRLEVFLVRQPGTVSQIEIPGVDARAYPDLAGREAGRVSWELAGNRDEFAIGPGDN